MTWFERKLQIRNFWFNLAEAWNLQNRVIFKYIFLENKSLIAILSFLIFVCYWTVESLWPNFYHDLPSIKIQVFLLKVYNNTKFLYCEICTLIYTIFQFINNIYRKNFCFLFEFFTFRIIPSGFWSIFLFKFLS